jgi:cbb3-type cytochrome oxidase subunit 3
LAVDGASIRRFFFLVIIFVTVVFICLVIFVFLAGNSSRAD